MSDNARSRDRIRAATRLLHSPEVREWHRASEDPEQKQRRRQRLRSLATAAAGHPGSLPATPPSWRRAGLLALAAASLLAFMLLSNRSELPAPFEPAGLRTGLGFDPADPLAMTRAGDTGEWFHLGVETSEACHLSLVGVSRAGALELLPLKTPEGTEGSAIEADFRYSFGPYAVAEWEIMLVILTPDGLLDEQLAGILQGVPGHGDGGARATWLEAELPRRFSCTVELLLVP